MSPAHNLRRLIAASALSNLADGMFQITLPLIALSITRTLRLRRRAVVGRLPWLLFALHAGALADRLDRRRTMLLVDLARAALIAALAATIVVDVEGLWTLYVVASRSVSARRCSTPPPNQSCPPSSTTPSTCRGRTANSPRLSSPPTSSSDRPWARSSPVRPWPEP